MLSVGEQGHEAEVHVQLLVTVEEREAGMVGEEIDFGLLVPAKHKDIFHDTRRWDAGDLGEFESVAMQMDRVEVITLIAQAKAIAAALHEFDGEDSDRRRLRRTIFTGPSI